MLLITVAQFIVFDKNPFLYAVIIFSDGSDSEELFSEDDASSCILNALAEKKLHPAEADYLREEMRKSPLPLKTPEGVREAFCEHQKQNVVTGKSTRRHLH